MLAMTDIDAFEKNCGLTMINCSMSVSSKIIKIYVTQRNYIIIKRAGCLFVYVISNTAPTATFCNNSNYYIQSNNCSLTWHRAD